MKPNEQKIICFLENKSFTSAKEISESLSISQANCSRYLNNLVKMGGLEKEKQGKQTFFRLVEQNQDRQEEIQDDDLLSTADIQKIYSIIPDSENNNIRTDSQISIKQVIDFEQVLELISELNSYQAQKITNHLNKGLKRNKEYIKRILSDFYECLRQLSFL